ncbi:hypothetical protein DPMN_039880 [Dreissena polymorpha]|uniref:Uncharacterized protein n=1 Tax=Dreissena polymorpha TaxID=45954 RepID=A0A9D4CVS9_DREPO|nr:hypothetical protein DPMN_039880 [Dreissena polymorpha]
MSIHAFYLLTYRQPIKLHVWTLKKHDNSQKNNTFHNDHICASNSANSFSSPIRPRECRHLQQSHPPKTVSAASAVTSAQDSASSFSSPIHRRQCQQLQQSHPLKTVPAASAAPSA